MLIVPALMLFTLILGIINRISVFESFAQGAREAFKLIYNTLPYLIAIFMAIELLRASGLAALLSDILAPFFKLVGIPKELAELIVLRPLSGSGSLIVLAFMSDGWTYISIRSVIRERLAFRGLFSLLKNRVISRY